MVKKLTEVLSSLPAKCRQKIQSRTEELLTLRELRLAAEQTQQQVAVAMGTGQDVISRLESRSDMLVSTLRQYVETLGGELEIVAKFPGRPAVELGGVGTLPTPRRGRPSAQRARGLKHQR